MMRLFNHKVLKRHIAVAQPIPATQADILSDWEKSIRSGLIGSQSETAIEGDFKQRILVDVLGYKAPSSTGNWTVATKLPIGKGIVDLALGNFTTDSAQVLAPFELKGANTKDLDAIMSGRNKTPVQQAWEYANAASGARWVLVTNYLELRLYSYSEGNQKYEHFDFLKLTDPEEYARFQLLLSAENLLGGKTETLLQESRTAEKDITDELYRDYKAIRNALIDSVQAASPSTDPVTAISHAQTILDRVLFIAFAEDTNLLPQHTLKKAYEHKDPYAPRPVWETFKALFRAIDEGSKGLDIPRYNGGLFQPIAAIDALILPDLACEGFKLLGEYDFASEISVTILGHIFEQSISDLERLQAIARGEEVEEEKKTGTSGQRKRHGVVYTPDYIARFIVERTVGTHLDEMFANIVSEFSKKGSGPDDYEKIKWKRQTAEVEAWQAYRDRLTKLKIVDPACGSGAFLVAAFDFLKAEYHRVNAKIADLSKGKMGLFDPDRDILTHNLYGVDVNAESIEITRLSLWLKTARRGKILDSLDHNIRVGDSLIEDANYAYLEHAFNWKTAFPEVFDDGGFDIVLGNPPYVRQELILPMKPYLETRFEVYHGVADLYCYFFERGLRMLKKGGRLGFISSSTFFKTTSGNPLKKFLAGKASLETVVNFGDLQIFTGVTTYPAILIMRKNKPVATNQVRYWNVDKISADNFSARFKKLANNYPQSELGDETWVFEDAHLTALRNKIKADKAKLKNIYGSPYRGVLTGRNKVFIINQDTRQKLIKEDQRSEEIIKPWLEGDAIQRWHSEPSDMWLIFTKRGIDIKGYPAVEKYLAQHREEIEPKPKTWKPTKPGEKWQGRKPGPYKWFEIQDTVAYSQKIEESKILFRDIANKPSAFIEPNKFYNDTTSYFVPSSDSFLLALLNSNVCLFHISGLTPMARGGYYRFKSQYVETIPIPTATDTQKANLGKLAEQCQAAAETRFGLQTQLRQRIPDLCPAGTEFKLNKKLNEWWMLDDFAAFRAQIKSALKADIPLKERGEWEAWLNDQKAEVQRLDAEIASLENEINQKVYALFDLTQDEIELLEANI